MPDRKTYKSALNVMKGIPQPDQISADAIRKLKSKKRASLSAEEYLKGILSGNRTMLSKAITIVESSRADHQTMAREIIAGCLGACRQDTGSASHTVFQSLCPPDTRQASIRIGITGVPGVGKSTFIEALGTYLTATGHKLAVLAIDPSSSRSRGSILGDKTRMELLAADPNAFIRPSPSAGSLGGVARKTRETIILCEAAGFDVIFVETVGVGQSETAVHSMVDFFLLMMLAGAGDELQGIKRGIMEMADGLIINKADGDNLEKARLAMAEYRHALHYFPPSESGWDPVVDICSATSGMNISKVWETIEQYRSFTLGNGYFLRRRQEQSLHVFRETLEQALYSHFYNRKETGRELQSYEKQIIRGQISPYAAAAALLREYYGEGAATHLT